MRDPESYRPPPTFRADGSHEFLLTIADNIFKTNLIQSPHSATKIRASMRTLVLWRVIMDGHRQHSEAVEEVEVAEDPSPHLGVEEEHQEAAFLVAKTSTLSR